MTLLLPTDAQCVGSNLDESYQINQCSSTPKLGIPVTVLLPALPVTTTPVRALGILQAGGYSYVNTQLKGTGSVGVAETGSVVVQTRGEVRVGGGGLDGVTSRVWGEMCATSWTVVMVGDDENDLAHRSAMLPLYTSPAPATTPSTPPHKPLGKLVRARWFTRSESLGWLEFVEEYKLNSICYDAGWYGNEKDVTLSPTAVWTKRGRLDIKEMCTKGAEKDVRIVVYVNQLAINNQQSLEEIMAVYKEWGVTGIKIGAVDTRTPAKQRRLHEQIATLGAAGFAVMIHGAYRPRGFTRTHPYLLTQAGLKQEADRADSSHHTFLPYVRSLAGAMDYGPRFIGKTEGMAMGATKAHQLALPIVLFSPVQSLLWGEEITDVFEHIKSFPAFHLWSVLPTTWSDTRFLGGQLAQYTVVARRAQQSWFVGAVTNNVGRKVMVNLTELFLDWRDHPALPPLSTAGYVIQLYADAAWQNVTWSKDVNVAPVQSYWIHPVDLGRQFEYFAAQIEAAPNRLSILTAPPPAVEAQRITKVEALVAELAPNGGWCAHIFPADEGQKKPTGMIDLSNFKFDINV